MKFLNQLKVALLAAQTIHWAKKDAKLPQSRWFENSVIKVYIRRFPAAYSRDGIFSTLTVANISALVEYQRLGRLFLFLILKWNPLSQLYLECVHSEVLRKWAVEQEFQQDFNNPDCWFKRNYLHSKIKSHEED